MNRGIVYIATGEKYVREALVSAHSAREQMPDIPVTIISDSTLDSDLITQTIQVNQPEFGFRDKVAFMALAPYEYSLFLDTDTFVCAPVYELFELLERFDIGLVHDGGFIPIPAALVPESFPQFNSGMMVFRKSKMQAIFEAWLPRFDALRQQFAKDDRRSTGWTVDEAALRELLFEASVQIAPISSQYNCRFIEGGYVAGEVKILHRHSDHDYETVAEVLNRYQGQRVYIADRVLKREVVGRFLRRIAVKTIGRYDKPVYQLFVQRLANYLDQYGFFGTIGQILKRIFRQV